MAGANPRGAVWAFHAGDRAHYIREDAPEEILPAMEKFAAKLFAPAPEPALAQ